MVLCLASLALGSFFLKPGDRVCFYGDSITEQRLYTLYVEDFIRTRYPKLDVTFINRGWSGDSTWGGGGGGPAERASKDVAPVKASVVTIMLGMNDGGYSPYSEKTNSAFQEWYGKLLAELDKAAPNARYTFIRTSPWDDFAHDFGPYNSSAWSQWHGYNDVLQRYGAVTKAYAEARKALYVDFNQPVADDLLKARAVDATKARQIIPDAIHPGPAGHLLMAGELLKAWSVDPVVSDMEFTTNGGSAQIFNASKAKVSNLKLVGSTLSWTALESSLPFAVDPGNDLIQLVLKVTDFTVDLNRETLKVKYLPAGAYALTIDHQKVGTFSSDTLNQGVNLALYDTPMRRQSLAVLNMARRRSDTDFTAWRTIQRPNGDLGSTPGAFEAVERMVQELNADTIKLAQPVEHSFVIDPIAP